MPQIGADDLQGSKIPLKAALKGLTPLLQNPPEEALAPVNNPEAAGEGQEGASFVSQRLRNSPTQQQPKQKMPGEIRGFVSPG